METFNDMKIFRSFLEATEALPPEEFKEAWIALMHYGLDRQEDDVSPTARVFLAMAKPIIDTSIAIKEGNSRGGSKSRQVASKSMEVTSKSVEVDTKSTQQDIGIRNKEEGIRNKDIKERRRFTPPTLQEVREYCLERKNKVDPEQFIDFYSSKGWKVGSQPMKDWKAAVRTWEKRDSTRQSEQKARNKFNRFEQRDYDFDALEAELLGIGGTA
jgi:hypothetical protein